MFEMINWKIENFIKRALFVFIDCIWKEEGHHRKFKREKKAILFVSCVPNLSILILEEVSEKEGIYLKLFFVVSF